MAVIDDEIPHPTHLGLNIAKVIPDDRPQPDADDELPPHPDPAAVARPVREVLPPDGTLPSEDYLDQIAVEAGRTLARVWELPQPDVVRWIRQALAADLERT